MKKLITLILVLTGMVSTASAETARVYFKPNTEWKYSSAWFAVCGQNSSGADLYWLAMTETSSGSGVYYADVTIDANCAKFFICRMNPADTKTLSWANKWNQSDVLSAPTSTIYYDISSLSWSGEWPNWNVTGITPASKTFNISNIDCEADILPNFMNSNSGAGTSLTSNGDFTYSRTVSGNVIRKGSYGFKLYDEIVPANWYSDTENSGAAWPVSGISTTEDACYDIEYTFNYLTGVASATATKKSDAVVTEKYVVAGDEELTGKNWDITGNFNVMTVNEGVGTLSYDDASLVANNNGYKIVYLLYNNDALYRTEWKGDPSNGYNNFTYNIGRTSIYDVDFTYTISTGVATCNCTEVPGYFLYGGTDGWGIGQRMTESAGVYTATINNPGYAFAIVPTSYLNGDNSVSDWSKVIRPFKTENQRTYLSFANNSGTTVTENSSRGWQIQGSTGYNDANDADVTISYTPGSDAWSVTCADIVAIGPSGWATYSNKYNYKVSGATNLYRVSAFGPSSVTLDSYENNTKFWNETPILIQGTPSSTVTISALNSDETPNSSGTNKLKPSNNGTLSVTSTANDGKYVFKWDGSNASTVGFYKAETGTGTLGAHKAYLDLGEGNAHEFLGFDFGEETTGIKTMFAERSIFGGDFYNIAGQRVAQPQKGLYIVNGKKVIIK